MVRQKDEWVKSSFGHINPSIFSRCVDRRLFCSTKGRTYEQLYLFTGTRVTLKQILAIFDIIFWQLFHSLSTVCNRFCTERPPEHLLTVNLKPAILCDWAIFRANMVQKLHNTIWKRMIKIYQKVVSEVVYICFWAYFAFGMLCTKYYTFISEAQSQCCMKVRQGEGQDRAHSIENLWMPSKQKGVPWSNHSKNFYQISHFLYVGES